MFISVAGTTPLAFNNIVVAFDVAYISAFLIASNPASSKATKLSNVLPNWLITKS